MNWTLCGSFNGCCQHCLVRDLTKDILVIDYGNLERENQASNKYVERVEKYIWSPDFICTISCLEVESDLIPVLICKQAHRFSTITDEADVMVPDLVNRKSSAAKPVQICKPANFAYIP